MISVQIVTMYEAESQVHSQGEKDGRKIIIYLEQIEKSFLSIFSRLEATLVSSVLHVSTASTYYSEQKKNKKTISTFTPSLFK